LCDRLPNKLEEVLRSKLGSVFEVVREALLDATVNEVEDCFEDAVRNNLPRWLPPSSPADAHENMTGFSTSTTTDSQAADGTQTSSPPLQPECDQELLNVAVGLGENFIASESTTSIQSLSSPSFAQERVHFRSNQNTVRVEEDWVSFFDEDYITALFSDPPI